MEETSDGFRLAEEDLRIRGPGNVLGTEQSGLPTFRAARMESDLLVLNQAREAALKLVRDDPGLERWPELRREINILFPAGLLPSAN
jgi:ATP-dependent DNA helicase RecG